MKDRLALLAALEDLDRRLRRSWSRLLPLPSSLDSYRRDWERTFEGEPVLATRDELLLSASDANPLLVGDYHSLSRPQDRLGSLLGAINSGTKMGLILELLPMPLLLPAREILDHPSLALVDGRSAAATYRRPLTALAKRGGMVAGAWIEGGVRRRDAAAARLWKRLARRYPKHHWTLFFGDWHLAPNHLPECLRREGAQPMVLHQSPEPLWERRPSTPGESFLRLGAEDWAWLHSPPLGNWIEALQDLSPTGSAEAMEIAEHLCEDLTESLALALGFAAPESTPGIRGRKEWPEFLASLPAHARNAFQADRPPKVAIYHPGSSQTWCPRPPSLNGLLESAAWALSAGNLAASHSDWREESHRVAFRRLLPSLLNPFLIPCTEDEIALQLFGWTSTRGDFGGNPAERYLAVEALGHRAGAEIAHSPEMGLKGLREFLEEPERFVPWTSLVATIRAA